MHTARIWMALAIPGGAPGYDDDKQFGNYITHMTARTSQRLREHSDQPRKVKGRRQDVLNLKLSGVFCPRREQIARSCHRTAPRDRMRKAKSGGGLTLRCPDVASLVRAAKPRIQPFPRLIRLHPREFRQLMPEPGELPFGVMAGFGAADFSRLGKRNLPP